MPPTQAPFTVLRVFARLAPRAPRTIKSFQTRPCLIQPSPLSQSTRPFSNVFRHLSDEAPKDSPMASHKPLLQYPNPETQPEVPKRPDPPAYEISLTCEPCKTRSTHRISKQGYHYGSVLITCPECRNRHIISDHLNVRAPW